MDDNIISNIYELYSFWKDFFSLKEEDDEELSSWIDMQFNYNNGKLKVKE